MRNIFTTLCAGIALSFMATAGYAQAGDVKSYNEGINIIPMPQSLTQNKGFFQLTDQTTFGATAPEAKTIAEFFAAKMRTATGYNIQVADKGDIKTTKDIP